MAARIVLFGATGYTGRLTAEAMVERGLKPVLAARSQDKLDALAEELGGDLETATADVADPPSVRALVESGDVLVTTVGPFALGRAAAAAATDGAHYIDSTGEPPFIREVFERYGPAAEQAGVGMLTALGTTGCRATSPAAWRSSAPASWPRAWMWATSSPAAAPR